VISSWIWVWLGFRRRPEAMTSPPAEGACWSRVVARLQWALSFFQTSDYNREPRLPFLVEMNAAEQGGDAELL